MKTRHIRSALAFVVTMALGTWGGHSREYGSETDRPDFAGKGFVAFSPSEDGGDFVLATGGLLPSRLGPPQSWELNDTEKPTLNR